MATTERKTTILKEEAGYRALVVPNSDPESPESDDAATPILRYRFNPEPGVELEVDSFNPQSEPYAERLYGAAAANPGGHGNILDAFQGAVNATEIASLTGNDGWTYISVCTPEWREERGLADADSAGAEAFLDDVKAWLEGDGWGWVIEKAEGDGWVEHDHNHGFYSKDEASEIGLSNLWLLVA